MFTKTINKYFHSESGAISVDYLVLTGIVVGFAISVSAIVGSEINQVMASVDVFRPPTNEFTAKFVSVDE